MFRDIVDVTDRLIRRFQISIETNPQLEMDISDWMTKYTINVTDTCLLDLNCLTLNNQNENLLHFGERVCDQPNMTPYKNALINQFKGFIQFFGFQTHYKGVTD